MAESNWKPIERAPKGVTVLLRLADASVPAFLGHQGDDGRWVTASGAVMLQPLPAYFCLIPEFDGAGE